MAIIRFTPDGRKIFRGSGCDPLKPGCRDEGGVPGCSWGARLKAGCRDGGVQG